MENMKAIHVDDEALEAAAGGVVHHTAWADYAQQNILPGLKGLHEYACREGKDKAIVRDCYIAMRNTTMPGEPIAKTVKSLWNSYDASAFQDQFIARQLYGLLHVAYQYVIYHS